MLPMEVADRTFHIAYGDGEGTAFALDVRGQQYLVTARHVVKGLVGSDELEIWSDGAWKALPVQLTGHSDVDISVLSPLQQLAYPEMILDCLGPETFFVGQDMLFAGFPLGLQGVGYDSPFPTPLLKKAMVSALSGAGVKKPLFLDGHNNQGFSGAPVYYLEPKTGRPIVVMVVASYTGEVTEALDAQERPTGHTIVQNSGIMAAFLIQNALELIDANPNGLQVGHETR